MWNFLIHSILHLVGKPISSRLTRRIDAVSPTDILSPSQLVRLTPRFVLLRRRRTIAGIVTVAICVLISVIGLYSFVHFAEPTPIEPILDQRTPFRRLIVPFFGLSLGGLIAIIVGRVMVARELDASSRLFWQYLATTTNRDARRRHWWAFIVGCPITVSMFLLLLNPGLVIDSHGVLASSGLFTSTLHRYDEVAEIVLYSRVDAPVGIVTRDNVCIRLVNGTEVRVDYEGSPERLPPVRVVAEFISRKSGILVSKADIRPRQ